MNNLKGLSCYLSGPIDFKKGMGTEWRDMMTPIMEEMNVKVLNPLKHEFKGSEDFDDDVRPLIKKWQKEGNYEKLNEVMKRVVHWDLRAVDLSSFLIVDYDNSVHMCGTYEEIFKANIQCKPVLLMCHGKKNQLSTWMYRFPHEHMFDDWDSLINYVKDIDQNGITSRACDKRWLFLL